ncbi:penicillin-binding protein [Fictibacillus gelatini]|uniref:penicillin-binding protein n=1 Tax=Fictibacillus gelatini TaxID=225985 RepID=UPI00040ACD50|nr:penicillin-binding protein [Fictibacillus gelatini]
MGRKKHINLGAGVIMLVFTLLFFVLIGRYFYVAYAKNVDHVDLKALGKRLWTSENTLNAKRGTIFDRNGDVLAKDVAAYDMYAILKKDQPSYIKDPHEAAVKLAPILKEDEATIEATLSKKGLFQVEPPGWKNLSQDQKEKIEKLDIPGIEFTPSTKRYYPNQNFASHVIGYTAHKNGKEEGVMGVERSLNEYLAERDGKILFQSDRDGLKLPDSKEKIIEPKNGDNVYLTLDDHIQLYLEEAMKQVEKEYDPKKMIGIVADPKTGRILAMANHPDFNLNKRDITNFTNDAISGTFEPGSTMKIFTLSAAIEEGVYDGSAKYKSGSYKVPGSPTPIHDWNQGWGSITFDEGVEKSSNVAFSILAREKLGFDRFYQYLKKFGFDKKTGIDLAGENKGTLLFQREIEKVTTAFGQGSTVTPIQLVQAATAVANGGKMMKPFAIEKIVDPKTKKVVLDHEPEIVSRPISESTAKHVRQLLGKVVTDGTGKLYNVKGYDIAGKTGTAQIADEKTGKYKVGKSSYLFSFLGMAPQKNPKLVFYIAVQEPHLKDTETGSEPVAKIFNSVAKNSLQYLNIAPTVKADKTGQKEVLAEDKGIAMDDYSGQNVDDVTASLKEEGLRPVKLGTGDSIIAQEPAKGTKVLKGERVILRTDGTVKMPDLTGWSLMDAMRFVKVMNLNQTVSGSGFVVNQDIRKNVVVKDDDHLKIELKPQYP